MSSSPNETIYYMVIKMFNCKKNGSLHIYHHIKQLDFTIYYTYLIFIWFFLFLKGKIILLIQICNKSINPKSKLLKTINDKTISRLIT